MVSTKVTKCNHFFHGKCLRKWLYVQDSCPLCYGSLYEDKEIKRSGDNIHVNHVQDMAQNDQQEGLIDHDHAMERPIDDSEENNSSDSTDDNDSDSSLVRNSDDINELAEDTGTSDSADDESQDNDEGSWSCSDEDDLLYDSMDDCKKNIHSEKRLPSPINYGDRQRDVTVTNSSDSTIDGLSSYSSKLHLQSSHLTNTVEGNNQALETDELQANRISSSSQKYADGLENMSNFDEYS